MATMDSFKRVRKKFLTCFRPLSSADDGSIKQKRHPTDGSNNIDNNDNNNKIVTYVSVHDQDNKMVLRKFLNSLSENNTLKVSPGGDDGGGAGCKKEKGRRAFSRAVKAVFFETSLGKKVRRRKPKKVSHASDSNRSATSIEDSKSKIERLMERPNSGDSSGSWSSLTYSSSSSSSFSSITPSNSLFSSSASSSMPSTSRRFSEQNRSFHTGSGHSMQDEEDDTMFPSHRVGKKCNSNFGLCLILLCLLVLMTWGRVFAIFCTSTCLFMIPSYVYRRSIVPPGQIVPLSGFDSAAHKKKVIMEGLLQRNRRAY